jgi:GrpB-like predicted nucleotidyltransferase (UPF0157 family)
MTTRVTHDGEHWSNAHQDVVELSVSDPGWPARFEAEAAAIRSTLGGALLYAVHHVGSTAVPGLTAKPVIDIVLEVPDRQRWPALIEPLARLEYVHWYENPDTSTMFFVKGMPPFCTRRSHHIHVHTPEAAQPVVRFRAYLIAHPDEAVRYEALKRDLAARFTTDRDRCTEAKAEFVREVLRKAAESSGDWRG